MSCAPQPTPLSIRNNLLKAFDEQNNVIDVSAIHDSILTLERINLSREDLEQTRLGKYINDIRKKLASLDGSHNGIRYSDIAKRAKNLVKKWRDDHLKTTVSPKLDSHTISNDGGPIRINGVDSHHKNGQVIHKSLNHSLSTDKSINHIGEPNDKPKILLKISKQKIESSIKSSVPTTSYQIAQNSNITTHMTNTSLVPKRKIKTTAELIADIKSKSKALEDIPLDLLSDPVSIKNHLSSIAQSHHNNVSTTKTNTAAALTNTADHRKRKRQKSEKLDDKSSLSSTQSQPNDTTTTLQQVTTTTSTSSQPRLNHVTSAIHQQNNVINSAVPPPTKRKRGANTNKKLASPPLRYEPNPLHTLSGTHLKSTKDERNIIDSNSKNDNDFQIAQIGAIEISSFVMHDDPNNVSSRTVLLGCSIQTAPVDQVNPPSLSEVTTLNNEPTTPDVGKPAPPLLADKAKQHKDASQTDFDQTFLDAFDQLFTTNSPIFENKDEVTLPSHNSNNKKPCNSDTIDLDIDNLFPCDVLLNQSKLEPQDLPKPSTTSDETDMLSTTEAFSTMSQIQYDTTFSKDGENKLVIFPYIELDD